MLPVTDAPILSTGIRKIGPNRVGIGPARRFCGRRRNFGGVAVATNGNLGGATTVDQIDAVFVVISELGRRLQEGESLGVNHGHGNGMFVFGNQIADGGVRANWPGLAAKRLFEGRDLAVTIDFRDILAEIAQQRLQNSAWVGCSSDMNRFCAA